MHHVRWFGLLWLSLVLVIACANTQGGPQPDAPQNGQCPGCAAPDLCCNISGSYECVLSSDPLHCGECGKTCDPVTSMGCSGGACKCGLGPECTAGSTCCNGLCKNLDTDPDNCGTCGRSCELGSACEAGECLCGGAVCGADEECCNDVCTPVVSDPNNCGACANMCTGDAIDCVNRECKCPGGGLSCPAPGQYVAPACCGADCVNLCADANHCGACDQPCTSFCLLGVCFGAPGPIPPPTACEFTL